tara:strand:- start:116 stop:598 length:483 start_codon:yes stop_codon:yes gene_type:complete
METINNQKKNRKNNAVQLPLDISNIILPKYVVYHEECYNREKSLFRNFFRIENYPFDNSYNIKKNICSSKSNKISIIQKLEEIKLKLNELNKNNMIDNSNNILPKYINIRNLENNKYMLYDNKNKDNDKRISARMLYDDCKDISLNINIFLNKLKKKYNI